MLQRELFPAAEIKRSQPDIRRLARR